MRGCWGFRGELSFALYAWFRIKMEFVDNRVGGIYEMIFSLGIEG